MKERNICIIFPEVNPIAGIILNQYISLLRPFCQKLWIITKNGILTYDEYSKAQHNSELNDEVVSLTQKIPMFIRMDLNSTLELFKIRKEVDLTVINHTRGSYLLPQVFAKLLGKKIVLITGGTPSDCINLQSNSIVHSIIHLVVRILEEITYYLSDKIILYSDTEIYKKPGLIKHRKKIVACGARFVDLDTFKVTRQINDRENIIGYVGRISEEKGIRNLVEAINQICIRRTNIHFLFIGEGPLTELIKNVPPECTNYIEFLGLIPHSSLPLYLNEMKLLVIPSYTEGLPKVLLEAMACGTPVLATPVGSIPDVIIDSENGFIMEDNSPTCIAENIIRVINCPDLVKIALSGTNLVATDYNYAAALRRYELIFKDL